MFCPDLHYHISKYSRFANKIISNLAFTFHSRYHIFSKMYALFENGYDLFFRMSALYGLLLFVWVTIVQGRDPIGQNLILILADGFGNSLLNSSQNDVNIGRTSFQNIFSSNNNLGLKAIAENGVTTEFLRPSFPTHSWPNWMSLITGMIFF